VKVDVKAIIEATRDLRLKRGVSLDDIDFWQAFIESVSPLCLADAAVLLVQHDKDWAVFNHEALQAAYHLDDTSPLTDADFIGPITQRCLANGFALSTPNQPGLDSVYLFVTLPHYEGLLLGLRIPPSHQSRISEALLRAQLIADIPRRFTLQETQNPSAQRDEVLNLLHLLIDVYQAKNFNSACYALVNGLVSCSEQVDQAVIGWQEGEYVRIKAISHYDRFEKKTETVKYLETALEEAADQRAAINYPQTASDISLISLAHKQLKAHLDAKQIFSFPLYDQQGEVQASLMLVSWEKGFSSQLLDAINFISNLLFEPLARQKQKKDFWFIRASRASRAFLGLMLGRQYVWTKVFTIVILTFLIWGSFTHLPHRVTAVSQLVTDSTQLISAPYDGHLTQVLATSGDQVEAEQVLARLDVQELMLQLAELQAEMQRAQGEVNKARASFNLIDTEIAQARLGQVNARMQRIDYFLNQADIQAPFEGIVVEGERQELLGAPVRKGQVLYRIARIEGLYLTLQVTQEDIDFIRLGSHGDFALISQPDVKYPFEIEQIIPMAKIQGPKGAYFEVKARFLDDPQDWWRPGMTGVAKVEAGEARTFWVLGHKLFNRLRMFLWI
jgi:biotin carboxyl carrier protein